MRPAMRNHLSSNFTSFRIKNINNRPKSNIEETPRISSDTIRVSNQNSKHRLKHGQDFKDLLDPRDQVLEHDFDFSIALRTEEINQEDFQFGGSQLHEDILEHVHQFLVETASNVVSAAFRFLCKGELTEQEAKEYAAKNLMLNLHSVFSEVATTIQNNQLLRTKIADEQLQEIKHVLIIEVENMISNVLINLADLYPQAQASGSTPRMREVIAELNRLDDQKNDLIFANDIKIKDYINEEGDYTEFIMRVLNTAIRVTHSNEEDSRDRTVREVFTQFNEQLFWTTQQQDYHSIINLLGEEAAAKQETLNVSQLLDKDSLRNDIVDFFDLTLERSFSGLAELTNRVKFRRREVERTERKQKIAENEGGVDRQQDISSLDSHLLRLMKNSERGVQEMKKGGSYALGQKIPTFVKEFSKMQISNKKFSGKHSSILRIMTKWAEYLQQIFEKPEEYIYHRSYPFKTTENRIVTIFKVSDGFPKIVQQLKDQYQEVKKKYQILVKNCYGFISELLSQREKTRGHVSRYADTRVVASKINAVLTYLMLNYLNLLIHHLLKAGTAINTDYFKQHINLVVFRVSDLMRSKLQCTERGFISLLKTMYLLDSSDSMRDKFKLVRIKNKLDDPANNIIVNYLFMGKVQCQLQLSIQEPRGKEKNYYTFSHFVYELTRGKFGTLAQCAIMIAQLDPMVTACRDIYYVEKQVSQLFSIQKAQPTKVKVDNPSKINESEGEDDDDKETKTKSSDEQFEKLVKDPLFECFECKRLIINESTSLYRQKARNRICNDCLTKSDKPEKYLKNKELKHSVLKAIEKGWLARIMSYTQFQKIKEHKCVAKIDERGHLVFNICIYLNEELRIFLVRLDSSILNDFEGANFDFTQLDSVDISKRIQKAKKTQKPMAQLWYVINDMTSVLKMMELDKIANFDTKLDSFITAFKDFRVEKLLIKSIKFKAGIINVKDKKQNFEKLGQIIMAIGSKRQEEDAQGGSKTAAQLKYRKFKYLECSSINELQARKVELSKIPPWVNEFSNLKILNLGGNRISRIEEGTLSPKLTYLNMPFNKLSEEVDLSILPKLNYVNLGSNQISKINLTNLQHLQHLDISNNKFQSFKFEGEFPNLRTFNMYLNKLTEIDLQKLDKLTTLDLDNNQLETIDLSKCPNLVTATLMKNRLKEVTVAQLPQLKELNLTNNQLTNVDLNDLQGLTSLNISNNQLSKVTLNNLFSLTRLDLTNNQLEEIDLSSLISLTHLNLSNNKLTKIDASPLTKLVLLSMKANILEEMSVVSLPNLSEISLEQNRIKAIQLQKLSTLSVLNLQNNPLSQVNFIDLPVLKVINMNSTALQEFICKNLPSLFKLVLQKTKLSSLELDDLPGLEELYLSNSSVLTSLQLSNFSKLRRLDFEGCPLTSIGDLPPSIKQLWGNRETLIGLDFSKVPNLELLKVDKGKTLRSQLANLRGEVKVFSRGQDTNEPWTEVKELGQESS